MGKLNGSGVDQKYAGLLIDIMNNGNDSDDRTGVGTLSTFGQSIEFNISNGKLPVIGCRRVAPRIAFEELMFMLNGRTQTRELEAKGVNIWNGNTTREFLDNRGLVRLDAGDFGRMYGAQLRNFNGVIEGKGPFTFIPAQPFVQFDQLKYMVDEINQSPTSRRIIATHYNPAEADQGALFPCHIMTQFNVDPRTREIDCLFWMRSSDVGFGLPYNLLYYYFFTELVGKLTGYRPRNLVYQAGDCHLYKDQIESGMIDYMIENAKSTDSSSPVCEIAGEYNKLEDMLAAQWIDVTVTGYEPFSDFKNKPGMAV